MKPAQYLDVARSIQRALIALAIFTFLAPQAFGSAEQDRRLLDLLDSFPVEMVPEVAQPGDAGMQTWAGDFAGAAEPIAMDGVLVEFRERPAPEKLYPIITGASVSDGIVTIDFDVLDEFGSGVAGLQQGENVAFSFTANKLVPGSGGKTDAWVSYVMGADEGVEDAQATTYSQGTFSAVGGGSYGFTFADSLESISDIDFEPDLTHRFGVEIRSAVISGRSVPGVDTAFDIQPSTGATTDIRQREIIVQEDCAACHGTEEFVFHGGARHDVRQCVSCHQPGSFDTGSGNTLDFGVMVHKIHTGANLTRKPFEFCGFGCENFGAPPDVFSNIQHSQSTQNCVACHDPANPATPQAVNVANAPTAESCASCHDDLSFDETGLTNVRRLHAGLAQPDSTCAACHSDNGLMTNSIEAHFSFNLVQQQSKQFQYNILSVSNTGEGESPVVVFSITDPTNNDQPYDLANDPAFTGSATSIAAIFAWPNEDYSNIASMAGTAVTGRPAGQPVTVTLVGSGPGLPAHVADNGDGTYTLDTFALSNPVVIPAAGLGSGTVAIQGRPAGDFDFDGEFSDRVPVQDTNFAFAITDAAPQPRRQIVALESCQDCHGVADGLSLHGDNRTDDITTCATCHNAGATDLFRRPVDPDGVHNAVNMAALDEREDQSVDFMYMIHAIHAAGMRSEPYVAYGFGSNAFDFSEVTYPRSPADCLACHVDEESYALPDNAGRQAKTVNAGATVSDREGFQTSFHPDFDAAIDPTDDNRVSLGTAVCAACHDSQVAIDHMSNRSDSFISFGNGFLANPDPADDPDTQARINAAQPENCAFCHGPGTFVDVADAHR